MTVEQIYFRACSQKGLLIDTNLLILLLVGRYKIKFIASCNRTSNFTVNDYLFIENLIKHTSAKLIVTPHILAEIGNLTFDKMLHGKELEIYFSHVLSAMQEAEEKPISMVTLLEHDSLLRFGFTDLANAEVAKEHECAVLTDDDNLYCHLLGEKRPVLNLLTGHDIKFRLG